MAKRLLKNRLINKDTIKEELVPIRSSLTDYITPTGKVYKDYGDNMFLLKSSHISSSCGYIYCGITYPCGNVSRRVHRLVAEAYIPNPSNLPYVGHKHNNKECTDVSELYWTDAKENTQRAYNDGVAKNAKGFDDSKTFQIDVFTIDGNFIETCGSVHIASTKYGVSMSTVLRHCRDEVKNYRGSYTFRFTGDNFYFDV